MEQDFKPHDQQRPAMVTWLGYGGLVPFVGLAALATLAPDGGMRWHALLLAYGAVILSFVGALHWAFAMLMRRLDEQERNRRYLWSVVPALMAWPCALLPVPVATLALITGFALQYAQDHALTRQGGLPAWYLPLRLHLSLIAVASLALASLTGKA